MAEGAFRAAAAKAGLTVETDSCGTAAYHVGEPPDGRAIATAAKHGVDISDLRGRQLTASDFSRFTHIFAMDHENLSNIQRVAPADASAHVGLLLDLVLGRSGQPVSDPYYGDEAEFQTTWKDVSVAAGALVAKLSR